MPIKEKVAKNTGNPRAGSDAKAKTRDSRRRYKFYDVVSGQPIDEDKVMKAPAGALAIDLTPAIRQVITDHVAQGNFLNISIRAAGISYSTFKNWMKKASIVNQPTATPKQIKDALPYIQLMNEVAEAAARAETNRVKIIDDASKNGNWGGAAWWLERRFPERWGKRQLVAHTGEIKHAHEFTQTIIADKGATEKAIDILEEVTPSTDTDDG